MQSKEELEKILESLQYKEPKPDPEEKKRRNFKQLIKSEDFRFSIITFVMSVLIILNIAKG